VMILTHIAALTGVYLLLQQMTSQNLYTAAGDAAMAVLADWEMGDTLLYQFYASGLITLPDSLKDTALLPLGQE
ncbi:hypothetical protein, partial [Klebsiella pneumoniae]|uniref:hypothetical protein n=1 Tax=Klebsiella pneumoniae TaxID=573 RepID=UPI0025A08DF4